MSAPFIAGTEPRTFIMSAVAEARRAKSPVDTAK